ncbi:MAG: hypothetical protein JW760_09005, partial [Spirochaetales bacterium]|nr:hypothetical protein [Spirochaetales bacterium]
MNRQSAAWIPVMLFLLLVLSGCPDTLGPFNPTVIDQIKDKNPPVITIITPEAYDAYTQTVTVTGRVTDDGESLPILTYTVTDESGLGKKAGDVTVTEGTAGTGVAGSFSFSFTTVEYSTDIILSVTATDWNGNAGDPTTLRLVYPGSTLSSFSLTPGNKQVSLSWEPISGADEYTVYYNSGGTAFNEATADSFTIAAGAYDGSDPVVLTAADHGVKNGVLCRVKVKASSAGGDQWSSSVLETLPLSQFSLLPKTDCFENKIVLYWRPASDGVTYQVWRSETGKEGPYELISGTSLTEPRFTDTQVQEGQRYHYRVGAEENSAQLSAPADASTTSMKTSGSAEIYRALKTDSIIALAVSGTTAYGVTYDIMTDSIEVISLDISLPSSPLELDRTTWNVPPGASLMSVYDIAVSEDAAFVSLWYSNPSSVYEVVAFDIGEPENLAEIGDAFIDCGDRALDLKVDGTRDLLYIAMDSDGLACVDISKPADQWTPVVASGWSGGNAWGVAFSGNYAYAANLGYGVTVGNFTSKTAPTIGSTVAPGSVPGADVYKAIDADPTENLLVMVSEHDDPDSAYYHGGVWALDITTPSVPVVKDSIDLGIPLTDVKLDGSYAFCSTGNGGVRMVDCNNPTELFERISYDTVGDSYKLDFFASGIAVGDGGGGVAVILPPDIENPTIIDDDINDLSQTNGSFLQEDILYIAARYCLYSLQVESDGTVSDLAVNADADSGDVVVLGDYAFVAVGEGGSPRLGVIDVADPGDLSNALFVECEKGPNSIDYWGDYLY